MSVRTLTDTVSVNARVGSVKFLKIKGLNLRAAR